MVASNNSFRLSEMYMEFEKYAMSTLKNERIIIDKSIILSISSSLDKYYFEEEIKRGLGCYNYSVMLDDGHKSNNEIGDALHVIVYSLWDIADNSKTAKENSIAFDLYNEKFLVKKEQVNLAIIVSDLKNINFSTLNFENRMQIFDYRVTQELQDVIDSTNSRNTWLFLSNRGIQSSYSENSAVYASLDLLHEAYYYGKRKETGTQSSYDVGVKSSALDS